MCTPAPRMELEVQKGKEGKLSPYLLCAAEHTDPGKGGYEAQDWTHSDFSPLSPQFPIREDILLWPGYTL